MFGRLCSTSELVPEEGKTSREVIFRSAIHEIHLWRVVPGEWVYPHIHPENDDFWFIIHGTGEYFLSSNETKTVKQGDIAVAEPGYVHGIFNSGPEDLIIYSVLSPLPVEIESAPDFEYPE
jgi:mannose-6-phosphate isomerase-like protein (cupin superfamily)